MHQTYDKTHAIGKNALYIYSLDISIEQLLDDCNSSIARVAADSLSDYNSRKQYLAAADLKLRHSIISENTEYEVTGRLMTWK